MASMNTRAYNGSMGQSPQRGPGAEPLISRSGGLPPEAEALLVFKHSMEAANLPIFLQFGNAKK